LAEFINFNVAFLIAAFIEKAVDVAATRERFNAAAVHQLTALVVMNKCKKNLPV